MPKKLYATLLLTVTLSTATAVHAEIYQWVDANGMIHYSDKAPQGQRSKTMDFGQLRRPGPPKAIQPKAAQPIRQAPVKKRQRSQPQPKAPKTVQRNRYIQPRLKSAQPDQLAVEKRQIPSAIVETPPDLNATEYDLRKMPQKPPQMTAKSVKQTLCSEKRMLLAALREKGFNSYYDEEGHYRLAWGGDGLYQGKRRFLNDKDVAKKTKEVMHQVEQYCDNPYDIALLNEARADWIRAEYCTVSKAVLEDLEHPFMRATDSDIRQQTNEVKRLCSEFKPGQYRDDDRYFPKALRNRVVLPRHLTLIEENSPEQKAIPKLAMSSPQETMEQLLALIE